MRYYSTNNRRATADFRQATIAGQAPDSGLYFPEQMPALPAALLNDLKHLPKEELAFEVMAPFVGHTMPHGVLKNIVSKTIDFPFPLKVVNGCISSLELFHGPTLAFKDVGARFMSQCLGYFMEGESRPVTVLVATSGDTGGAVANGFYGVDGVRVIILYPSGKVSSIQEKQLTTLGKNITALEVAGSFDDCQRMVKTAFADAHLMQQQFLTSANSINVARWLPQQLYYFFALQQWQYSGSPVVSVPSGNFGNICAGLTAWRRGLPIAHFIAACNANDSVVDYLENKTYAAKPPVATLSNAMDVGDPSNFVRLLHLFDSHHHNVVQQVSAVSVSDDDTKNTIKTVFDDHQYLLDPHGAVAFYALEKYLHQQPGAKGFLLETAHPVKFYDVVESIIHEAVPVPPAVQHLLSKPKESILIAASYPQLKEFLLQ